MTVAVALAISIAWLGGGLYVLHQSGPRGFWIDLSLVVMFPIHLLIAILRGRHD